MSANLATQIAKIKLQIRRAEREGKTAEAQALTEDLVKLEKEKNERAANLANPKPAQPTQTASQIPVSDFTSSPEKPLEPLPAEKPVVLERPSSPIFMEKPTFVEKETSREPGVAHEEKPQFEIPIEPTAPYIHVEPPGQPKEPLPSDSDLKPQPDFDTEGKTKTELEAIVKALKRQNYVKQSEVQQQTAQIYAVENSLSELKSVKKQQKSLEKKKKMVKDQMIEVDQQFIAETNQLTQTQKRYAGIPDNTLDLLLALKHRGIHATQEALDFTTNHITQLSHELLQNKLLDNVLQNSESAHKETLQRLQMVINQILEEQKAIEQLKTTIQNHPSALLTETQNELSTVLEQIEFAEDLVKHEIQLHQAQIDSTKNETKKRISQLEATILEWKTKIGQLKETIHSLEVEEANLVYGPDPLLALKKTEKELILEIGILEEFIRTNQADQLALNVKSLQEQEIALNTHIETLNQQLKDLDEQILQKEKLEAEKEERLQKEKLEAEEAQRKEERLRQELLSLKLETDKSHLEIQKKKLEAELEKKELEERLCKEKLEAEQKNIEEERLLKEKSQTEPEMLQTEKESQQEPTSTPTPLEQQTLTPEKIPTSEKELSEELASDAQNPLTLDPKLRQRQASSSLEQELAEPLIQPNKADPKSAPNQSICPCIIA